MLISGISYTRVVGRFTFHTPTATSPPVHPSTTIITSWTSAAREPTSAATTAGEEKEEGWSIDAQETNRTSFLKEPRSSMKFLKAFITAISSSFCSRLYWVVKIGHEWSVLHACRAGPSPTPGNREPVIGHRRWLTPPRTYWRRFDLSYRTNNLWSALNSKTCSPWR